MHKRVRHKSKYKGFESILNALNHFVEPGPAPRTEGALTPRMAAERGGGSWSEDESRARMIDSKMQQRLQA